MSCEINNKSIVVVIGAMKSGTSSIHQYLNYHNDIEMSAKKELDFFVEEKNWNKGMDWYIRQFQSNRPVIGESSPNYTKYPSFKGVPERMHKYVPHAKLIYLVRDPYIRIISHYVHNVAAGVEHRSFDELLSSNDVLHYIWTSRYWSQLQQYLLYYASNQIYLVMFENMISQPVKVMRDVYRFIGVDDSFSDSRIGDIYHGSISKVRPTSFGNILSKTGIYGIARNLVPSIIERNVVQPVLTDPIKNKLYDMLIEDISNFKSFTGWSLNEWMIFNH